MVFRLLSRIVRTLRGRNDGPTGAESNDSVDAEIGELPESCLRGLRKPKWIVEERFVASEAFMPDPRTATTREDGGMETSVNWEDHARVEDLTLEDRTTAEHGAARLLREHVRSASRGARSAPLLCERQPLADNEHHGNIVFPAGTPKVLQVQLAGAMAMKSHLIKRSR